MSDISTNLRQYPPPDKRKKNIISTSSLRTFISDKKERKSESIAVDKFIQSQVDLVSKNNIERWINSLTSFHNRHSKSIYNHQVASWLKKELEISGYKDKYKIKEEDKDKYKDIVDFHVLRENGLELKNVICHKQGQSNKIIIVCGHYDTVLGDNPEDAVSRAPGANDNASGVAAILEIARILFTVDLKYSIRFVWFSGEEQGLRGSEHYANAVKREKEDLILLINLDMIGVPNYRAIKTTIEKEDTTDQHNNGASNKKIIQIDIDKEFENEPSCNEIQVNDEESDRYGTIMKKMAQNYTDIQGEEGSVYSSDYCPFESRGYVVIGAYDRSAEPDNPHYHSSSDLPTNLDFDYLTSVTKMVLATILHVNKENLSC